MSCNGTKHYVFLLKQQMKKIVIKCILVGYKCIKPYALCQVHI
jgi:hypothetical protein